MGEASIDPRVRIGHVHLKVANLQRALDFYCGILGFEPTQRYGKKQRLFPRAVIIIISDSTFGRGATGRHRQRAQPAFIISRFCIRAAPLWPMLSDG
jgi:catechol 2,3-dioxygenase-like lactoylglutathione lyase family enzyme